MKAVLLNVVFRLVNTEAVPGQLFDKDFVEGDDDQRSLKR
jgi:hypothetical protein